MLDKLIRWSTRYMAVGVMIAGFLGILFPAAMKPYARFIPTLLGIIMFGMGMSLKAEDFRNVFRDPRSVAVGAILQFTIMPLLAYVLVTLLALPPEIAIGVVLVGCCPGVFGAGASGPAAGDACRTGGVAKQAHGARD